MWHCLCSDVQHMHVWLRLTGPVKFTDTCYRIWHHGNKGLAEFTMKVPHMWHFVVMWSRKLIRPDCKKQIYPCMCDCSDSLSLVLQSVFLLNMSLKIHWCFKGFLDGICCVENRSLDAYSIDLMTCGIHQCIGNLPANYLSARVIMISHGVNFMEVPHLWGS